MPSGKLFLGAGGKAHLCSNGKFDIGEACCGTTYKLTPCVAPIYELIACGLSGGPSLCNYDPYYYNEDGLVGVLLTITGVTNKSCVPTPPPPEECSPEDCPCRQCADSGTDGANCINGTHFLHYKKTSGYTGWQTNPYASGCYFEATFSGPGRSVRISGSYRVLYPGGSYECRYFGVSGVSPSVNCTLDPWVAGPFANEANTLYAEGSLGSNGDGYATITAVYTSDPSRCPGSGSIYTQDESTCYSGTTPIYTNDDLSAYVGKCVVLNTGICYMVTQESGGTAQSVTVSSSNNECPPDKYAEYDGKVVTLEVGDDTVCFYMSVGGEESDGEVTILGSYDTCNECCGSA